jgi:anti-anti-sigma regulatory factor
MRNAGDRDTIAGMNSATDTHPTLWTEEYRGDEVEVVHLADELSVATAQHLAARLEALAADGRNDLIVDLGAVRVLDPIAMLPLVKVSRRLRSRRVRLSMVPDPSRLVFEIPGMEEFHDVAMTVEAALEHLDDGEPAAPAHVPAPLPVGTLHHPSLPSESTEIPC